MPQWLTRVTGKEDIHCGFDIVEICVLYMTQNLNCDIVFRKALTSLSFSGRTTSSETASTMETESESDLQDYRSCAFDSRSGGEKLKGAFSSNLVK